MPKVVDAVFAINVGSTRSTSPVPAVYGPWSRKESSPPTATAAAPATASRRGRGASQPAGQQNNRKAGMPRPRASPA